MSTLGNYIRAKMEARGWKQVDLAAASGIPKTTLSGILTSSDPKPDLAQYVKLADALQVDLLDLLEAGGIPVNRRSSPDENARRLAMLVKAMPWLQQVIDHAAALRPEHRAGLIAFLEAVQRPDRGRKG